MISLYIYIKHHMKSLWGMAERFNGPLTQKRYPKLRDKASEALDKVIFPGYDFSLIKDKDLNALEEFRARQDNEYLAYFDPHAFDYQTLHTMLQNQSYVMMKVTETGRPHYIIGYFFLRCFFIGKVFHGLIVDEHFKNRGIGTEMWRISTEICDSLGMRMYATVSKFNQPSLSSARKASEVKIAENLANDFYLIELKQRKVQ